MDNKQEYFLELFEPIKHNLWRFCLSVSNSYEDAKDLLQDTIEIAYKKIDSLKDNKFFLSWLFSIASRKYIEKQNKRKYEVNSYDYDALISVLASNEGNPELQTDIKLLYEALEKLPYQQKEAVILSEIIGLNHKDIGIIQSVSTEAVKQRVYRAKQLLKSILINNNVDSCITYNNL